jgi:hypothetical protein
LTWRTALLLQVMFLALLARASAVITGGKIIEGVYEGYTSAGAPTAGTNEVQTLTIGGTPTGGTFKLAYDGAITGAITWSATNATLLANLQAALDALANLGTNYVVATAGTLTAGIGTILLTFSGGSVAKRAVNTITVANNSLTGTTPTLAVAETTPGVDASGLGAAVGAKLVDTVNGIVYANTGTATTPTWTKVGLQT